MNSTVAITAVLAILSQISGLTSQASVIAKVIAALTELLPLLVALGKDLIVPVKNIIAALKDNAVVTPEQLDALEAFDAKVDADFEAALAKAEAEDEAATKNKE